MDSSPRDSFAALLVGVDAGGTRTVAVLAAGERIFRTANGGPANPNVVGFEAGFASICSAIETVLGGETPAAIGVGVAGAGDAAMRDRIDAALKRRFNGAAIAVAHDARIALRAAIPYGDGIVLVAGTGSIAYAEVDSQTYRAGGRGHLTGDRGSGYAIGAAALRATGSVSALPVAEVAAYAPKVLAQASAGDECAAAIVADAADALLGLVADVAAQCAANQVPLAFAGGLLRQRNALTEQLDRRLSAASLSVRPIAKRVDPYFGALAEARALLTLR